MPRKVKKPNPKTDTEKFDLAKLEYLENRRYRIFGIIALVISGAYAFWNGIYGPQIQFTNDVQKIEIQNEYDLGAIEAEYVLSLVKDFPLEQRDGYSNLEEKLCDMKKDKVITSIPGLEKIGSFTRRGEACEIIKEIRLEAIRADERVERCEAMAEIVTDSCSASDKSGFNSRPSARCAAKIEAGAGRFLSASSYNLKRTGKGRLSSTAAPRTDATVFTVYHSCSDSRGTGRTCNVSANISAKSYPDSCSEDI